MLLQAQTKCTTPNPHPFKMSSSNMELVVEIDYNSLSKEECIEMINDLRGKLAEVTAEKRRLEQEMILDEEKALLSSLDRDLYESTYDTPEDSDEDVGLNKHDDEDDEVETRCNRIFDKKYKRKYVDCKK